MKYIGRDLLTLLISLFILSGCETPDEIGLDLDSADQINTSLTTTPIRTVTVREDSLITNSLARHPIGYIDDPAIGKTESHLAVAVRLAVNNLKVNQSPVLDSAFLVLSYGGEIYGYDGTPLTLNVHQLNEKFNPSKAYYNTKKWNYNSQIIGSRTFNPLTIGDSVKLTDIVQAGIDTQKVVAAQLRIPISKSFINSNILGVDTSVLNNTVKFANHFKGLYVTLDRSNGAKGMVLLDLNSGANGLDLYYKTTDGTKIDSNIVHFSVSNDSAAVNIEHTYVPAVKAQLDHPEQEFSTVYTQAMGGLRTKINFPSLQSLKDMGNIIINKAELILSIEGGSDLPYAPAPRLILYRSDIADQRQFVPDNASEQRSLSDASFGGFYDAANKRYNFVITSYLQDILSGKLTQYDTFVAPIYINNLASQRASSSATGSTAGRSILGGGNGSTYKMKLNIIYTKID